MRFVVGQRERAFVYVDETPKRYLRPGTHDVRTWFRRARLVRYSLSELIVELSPDEMALVPDEDLALVQVRAGQRALVRRLGQPTHWLQPGVYHVWTAERFEGRDPDGRKTVRDAISVEHFDTGSVEVEPLPREVADIASCDDYMEVEVPQGHAGLRFVDGALDAVLPPGRYGAWTTEQFVRFQQVDTREQVVDVHGQEVMTRDRVSLRLNLSVVYRIADVERYASVARDPRQLMYLAVQMAARDAVSERTLDELLAERDALSGKIQPQVAERAENTGLQLLVLGLKDLILPGDMKALLNQVIEARKQAEASVILRREEIAATRSMAKTAEVMAENPVLLRLKELEAYKELAEKVGSVELFLGRELGDFSMLR